MSEIVWKTELPGLPPPRRGKVRDLYDLGDHLLIVACDRLSAYDHVLEPGIPDKGKILNQVTTFWFGELGERVGHHLVATDPAEYPQPLPRLREVLAGRSALVRKCEVVPFECVARGYLAGSGYREYQEGRAVCGVPLVAGLERASRLPEPIFTPATKAASGHDENVPFEAVVEGIGSRLAGHLRQLTLEIYSHGARRAAEAGLILADTKFEFGLDGDRLLLIDEVMTPDSSRYWDAEAWSPGTEPTSFDKQYVRNWLDESGWDHRSPPPRLPDDVVRGTRERYLEAFRRLTGGEPEL